MASRRSKPISEDERRLFALVEDLDRRVTQLEARLRLALSVARAGVEAKRPGRSARPRSRRPRCPGCTLELPRGARGDTCVWCGFRFDAVGRRLLR